MKKMSYILLICIFVISCSEFSSVKKPSIIITSTDLTADSYEVDMQAGKYGVIFYTTDGTDPNFKSILFSSKMYLQYGTTIKAASFCPGGRRSEIVSTQINNENINKSQIQAEYCTPKD